MGKKGNILSKENSLLLRGLAILSIMFHNYLHMKRFGFCVENEGSFVQEKADAFFQVLAHPMGKGGIVFHSGSFLGWLGVSVFVFLTGYGLALKYPPSVRIDKYNFLKNSYLKLFFLLFPALLFFTGLDVLHGSWDHIAKRLIELSMMSNLYYSQLRVDPGVYWYFSLTFQFYILYCLGRKWFKPWLLLVLSVLSMAALYWLSVGKMPGLLRNFRACCTGWFPLFALGIWFARDERPGKWLAEMGRGHAFVLLLLFSALVVAMNARLVPWLAVPIAGLFAFFALAKLFVGIPPFDGMLKWIGGISAGIFVCHPIMRYLLSLPAIANMLNIGGTPVPGRALVVSLCVYAVLTFVMAFFYQKLQIWLSRRFWDGGRGTDGGGRQNEPKQAMVAERSEA